MHAITKIQTIYTNLCKQDILAKAGPYPPLMEEWQGSMSVANQVVVPHENKLA